MSKFLVTSTCQDQTPEIRITKVTYPSNWTNILNNVLTVSLCNQSKKNVTSTTHIKTENANMHTQKSVKRNTIARQSKRANSEVI